MSPFGSNGVQQEKLMKVFRLRMTDEMFVGIQHYQRLDGRERFEEAVRRLITLSLKTEMKRLCNGQGVESGELHSYVGPKRRRSDTE